jgi:hypothetical protein
MKRHAVLAVLLVAALPGSLLIGCLSDNADTANTTTPPANPLVGTWLTEGPISNPVVVLEMAADGTWTFSWGPSRDRVVDPGEGFGTYEVDGNTVTWLGGACEQGVKGIYTYTLQNDQFTQTATDEPCDPRRSAYDGVTYTAEKLPPRPPVTGTVTVAGNEVIVRNGTPQRDGLLRWALQRFADTGLPAPAPTSVTFAPPVADPWTTYGFDPDGPNLVLPSTAEGCPDEGCDAWPPAERVFALTELARLWAASDTSWTRLREFAQAHGLDWEDFDDPESQPVVDLATAIVTWGLMDQPYDRPETLAGRTCDQLAADFLALTQASTAGAACPPPGG